MSENNSDHFIIEQEAPTDITPEEFQKVIKTLELRELASDMDLYEIVPIIMRTSFFRDLQEKKFFIESLRRMEIQTYEPGEIIYEEE